MNIKQIGKNKGKISTYALEQQEVFWGYKGEQRIGKEKLQLITPLSWGRKSSAPRISQL